jgi:hypothetical protein
VNRRLIVAIGSAAAIVLLALTWGMRDRGVGPDMCPPPRGYLFPDGPVPNGEAISLAEAERSAPMSVHRPNWGFASDDQISTMWWRADDSLLYITYETGAVVTIRPSKGTQPTGSFAQAQISDGVPGEIISINGTDVFSVPPDVCFNGSARFTAGDAEVVIIGSPGSSVAHISAVAGYVISHAPTSHP